MKKIYLVWYSETVKELLASLVFGDVSPDDMGYKARTYQSHVYADSREEAIQKHKNLMWQYMEECQRILYKDAHKELRVHVSPCHLNHTLEVRCVKYDYLTSTAFFIRDMLASDYEEIIRELGRHVPYLLAHTNLNNPPCFNTWEEGLAWLKKDENTDQGFFYACKDEATWDKMNRELIKIKPDGMYRMGGSMKKDTIEEIKNACIVGELARAIESIVKSDVVYLVAYHLWHGKQSKVDVSKAIKWLNECSVDDYSAILTELDYFKDRKALFESRLAIEEGQQCTS